METVSQKLKNGEISVREVPFPIREQGGVTVRNIYSCISIGTESSTLSAARKGYIGKAKARPQQFKQVLEKLRQAGLIETYQAVMKKLDALSPLGYSCVGEVIDVASDVNEFTVGDIVACGGSTANHAEIVFVPKNLCVKIHRDTDLKQAAYNTLGAIALQGIRQADLRLGETCGVIGLGVIGQLTCNLLQAAGIKTIGIDTRKAMVTIAKNQCVDLACIRQEPGISKRISAYTKGIGTDAVIITASSSSLDPINFAGEIVRKKGTIVVVGGIPTGFDREPYFYNKELKIKMSCSYGPGRYDKVYEEKGHDYPLAYVRWTEKRNMEAFQELIYLKKININYLTSHIFKLSEAPEAYNMILRKKQSFLGILIEYNIKKNIVNNKVTIKQEKKRDKLLKFNNEQLISVGFIGAGSYAQGFLLPNVRKNRSVIFKGIMTRRSTSSRTVSEKYGFEFCTSNVDDILCNDEINTVFIATRHDSHGSYVIQALQYKKNVFVEKPLCITIDELEEINRLMKNNNHRNLLFVGYNRRFSPITVRLKSKLSPDPMSMIYRINAGYVDPDSWAQDIEIGGGRILGEVCHFIDYLTYICNSFPECVYANVMKDPHNTNDTLSISINYSNGSIGTIHYFANGSKRIPKEYIEIYQNGLVARIDDFKKITVTGNKRITKLSLRKQNKGQESEIETFFTAIKTNNLTIMPFEQIYNSSKISFKIIESYRTNSVICL